MKLAADTITDEQIRELRQASATWIDENGSCEGISYDEYHAHAVVVRCCDVALGKRRSRRIGGKRAGRARCAEILNARAEGK